MFRQNIGVDLNEFPALGTVKTNHRGTPTKSYASTTAATHGDYHGLSMSSNYNSFAPDLARKSQSKKLTIDDFPALNNNNNIHSTMNSEVWNGYPLDSHGSDSNDLKQFGTKRNSGQPLQWAPGRNDLTLTQPPPQLPKSAPGLNMKSPAENSAAAEESDSYGLLGLLGVIRMTDPDRSMLALGSDLTTLGLDLNTPDPIYSTFISPWSDTQSPPGLHVEPGYYIPNCYRNVKATPPAHERMRAFSDDILFYAFYCMPRDISQEAAAQELYNRNWRYHKEMGLWLTKEADENGRPVQSFIRPSSSSDSIDRGLYIFFDPTTWQKVKREWTISWDALEDRNPTQPTHT